MVSRVTEEKCSTLAKEKMKKYGKGGIVCRESEIMIVSYLRSKILLLGKTQISLVFHSLHCIFAA